MYVDDLLFSGSTFKIKFTIKLTYVWINTRHEQDIVYSNQKGQIQKEIYPLSEEYTPIRSEELMKT